MKFIIKLTIILGLVFCMKTAFVETNNIATAEIGGWLGRKAAKNHGGGAVHQTLGAFTGAAAGESVGATAGAWIGGAIGSFGGPAGAVFGVWAGGIAGGIAGAM